MKIEITKEDDNGSVCWSCSSVDPNIEVPGRTPNEALNNWQNIKWMLDHPERVDAMFESMINDIDLNVDRLSEAYDVAIEKKVQE